MNSHERRHISDKLFLMRISCQQLQPMTNCMTVATSTDEENDCKSNIELSVLSLDNPQQGPQPQQPQPQQAQGVQHDSTSLMSLDGQGPQSQQPTPQPVQHDDQNHNHGHGHSTPQPQPQLHSQENRVVMTSPALIMSTTLTPLTTIQPTVRQLHFYQFFILMLPFETLRVPSIGKNITKL